MEEEKKYTTTILTIKKRQKEVQKKTRTKEETKSRGNCEQRWLQIVVHVCVAHKMLVRTGL